MIGIYVHVPLDRPARARYLRPPDSGHDPAGPSVVRLVDAMLVEIEARAADYGDRGPADTVYFGGGRPGVLPAGQVGRILTAIDRHFTLDAGSEVTVEVRPDDAREQYLEALRAVGVNRLSLGVRSFFEEDLARIGAGYDGNRAEGLIDQARAAGFENLSVDLVLGLPRQPLEYWGANLQRAARLDVPHVYLDEWEGPFSGAEEELEAEDEERAGRYVMGVELLRAEGYELYEISYFARPGFRSRHNARYWALEDVLGIGPGAHSFCRHGGGQADRWANVPEPNRYGALLHAKHMPVETRSRLDLFTLADEYVLFRLRTAEGIDLQVLEDRYGVDLLTEHADDLAALEAEGFIEPIRGARVRLTDAGRLVCDAVTRRLLV